MAKRRTKKRTHVGAPNGNNQQVPISSGSRIPKSMVIRVGAGEVGPSVSQLVKDMRRVMEPHTASRLKERKSNKLKDFITMSGPLGVTDLLLFSRSANGNTNLRIARHPRGPTLHFRVEKYSLCKDIQKSSKHYPGFKEIDYLSPPFLVQHHMKYFSSLNHSSESKRLQRTKAVESLMADGMFYNLVPPVAPTATSLSSIRRVMLLEREIPKNENDPFIIHIRHYAITTKQVGLSKAIKRINAAERKMKDPKHRKGLPNFGKLEDAADYILDPGDGGYTSASETELETDAEVEVLESETRRILNKKKAAAGVARRSTKHVEKRAIKLVEIGPRLRLRLLKVEEGLCEGRVMWHESLEKSEEEERNMDKMWEKRKAEKEARRKEQRENVERKKKEKQSQKKNGDDGEQNENEDEEMDDDDEWDEDFDDEDLMDKEEGHDEQTGSNN
ncbi:MAG: hypothetical protein M1834_000602 [Cirrosporium novae-zelandiae]|nr:MAG: hypothetical protein M1834_000602 [Cirrosporium novae-zelandiae]